MSDGPDVRAVLEERPDLRPAVEAALDAEQSAGGEPWTFDDVDVDSGRFGELVSRDVVESIDGGYRLRDPEAVRRAIQGDAEPARETAGEPRFDFERPSPDRRVLAAVVGVLALVVAFRLVSLPAVFRDGRVVLSGNDPYFYRYWVEQLVTGSGLDVGLIADLPNDIATEEPLLVASLAVVAVLLGGPQSIGGVMAWYPVVLAVGAGLLVYLTSLRVTDDRRIALAAVALLAVTPAHAFRTSLGFADHHAFDFFWLALTATAIVFLESEGPRESPRAWGFWNGLLGIGIAGQALAWEAGALLIAAIGIYAVAGLSIVVRNGGSPTRWSLRLVPGLTLGVLLVWLGVLGLSWQTPVVAVAVTLLLAGAIVVWLFAAVSVRAGWSFRAFVGAIVVLGLAGVAAVSVQLPALYRELTGGLSRIVQSGSPIAEMQPLIGEQAFGGLFLMGFILVAALPAMAWATRAAWRDGDGWLPLVCYGWYLLGLSLFQVRFLGELAIFTAVFGGVAFVWLANRVDLAEPPFGVDRDWRPAVPSPRAAGALLALFLLVGGLAAVQVPVKTSQLTVSEGTYQTTAFLVDHAERVETSANEEVYVLSMWDDNRIYNYFVSGQSRSYDYARRHYLDFLRGTDARAWYERLNERVDYVVVTSPASLESRTIGYRLHRNYGSNRGTADGMDRYRTLFVSDDRSHVVVSLVPGAEVRGTATPGERISLSTPVEIPGATFNYTRIGHTGDDGNWSVRVAHPGEYTVRIGERTETVAVPESAVTNGEPVRIDRAS